MSDIVSRLKEIGKSNHIDMSGRHTIAECLNAFGGGDRREIAKAVKGAVKPVAVPLLVFNNTGSTVVIPGVTTIEWAYNNACFTIHGPIQTIQENFKSDCNVTLKPGMYRFSCDFPNVGENKGLVLYDASDDSVIDYANKDHSIEFGFMGENKTVYLKVDATASFDLGNTTYNFLLCEMS